MTQTYASMQADGNTVSTIVLICIVIVAGICGIRSGKSFVSVLVTWLVHAQAFWRWMSVEMIPAIRQAWVRYPESVQHIWRVS